MKIDYDSKAHKKILEFVDKCFKLSEDSISQRYHAWEKADKMDRSFIDVAETDDKGKSKNPFERQIYIPHSRACKDTLKTYLLSSIGGKRPMIRIHGRGPEDVKRAVLNQIVMDYQAERQRLLLVLDTFLNDILKNGLASIKNTYGRQWAKSFKSSQRLVMFPYPHLESVREEVDYIAYEGPFFGNNDPYKFFPDPRVPMGRASEGQFVGFEYDRSRYYLQKKESEGAYYNIDVLKRVSAGGSDTADSNSGSVSERDRIRGFSAGDGANSLDDVNPIHKVRELWVEIVPRDLDIEDGSSYPQEWVFTVADGKVLIRSDLNEFAHGGKPEVRAEFDRDGYSKFNLGYYEGVEGMQDLINFLYNSHIENIRGYLNNMMVYDPGAIETADLLRPGPRRLVRLKKSLYGKGVNIDSVLRQLNMGDVTHGHIKDAAMIMDHMQRQSHTPDALQGIETEIKRTATEIAKVSNSGQNHLAQSAMLLYAQAIVPLAEQWLMNNQKFMEEQRFYRITGDYAKQVLHGDPRFDAGHGARISPDDIQGVFDFPVDDGRMPVNPEDHAEIWMEILKTVAQTPPLQQRIDVMEIFSNMVRAMGVKNVDDFKLKANVMPDERIERMRQAGDVIPLNQYLQRGADGGGGVR